MNLIEAIKSGKRFRRVNGTQWLYIDQERFRYTDQCDWIHQSHPVPADILADDWEIEEKKIEITHGQLMQAVERILSRPFEGVSMAIKLAKELGLE